MITSSSPPKKEFVLELKGYVTYQKAKRPDQTQEFTSQAIAPTKKDTTQHNREKQMNMSVYQTLKDSNVFYDLKTSTHKQNVEDHHSHYKHQ
jgi:hypothetical protein